MAGAVFRVCLDGAVFVRRVFVVARVRDCKPRRVFYTVAEKQTIFTEEAMNGELVREFVRV